MPAFDPSPLCAPTLAAADAVPAARVWRRCAVHAQPDAGPGLADVARRAAPPWPHHAEAWGVGIALALTLWLAGCGSPRGTPGATPQAQPTVDCSRLGGEIERRHKLTRITDASRVRADDVGHPAHCRVRGQIDARAGVDGQAYAIGFELRLPEAWNERFLHQTNGGTDGELVPATGALAVLPQDALSRGFAVLSSDGGHVADDPARASLGLARGAAFGHDPQARRDFAGDALDALWPVAQTALQAHYGHRARTHYLAGCGNGGRLGLVAARRFPDRYDGILAGAPALHWPQAALQHAWDWQQWKSVHADPRQALTRAQLEFVGRRVRERCDALDLLEDGQVQDVARCQRQFDPRTLVCKGPRETEACLDTRQLQALRFVMAGPHDDRAEPMYVDWPWDPGIAALGWRHWRLHSDVPGWDHQPVAATVGAAALAHLFSTPPQPVAGSIEALETFLLNFDWGQDPARLWASVEPFGASMVALMSPAADDQPRLDGFYARGGRMLIYHGSADPAFSVHATTRWVSRLQSHWGLAKAQQSVRAFVVPGMGHCGGGPATDRFDALSALVDWVERGQAPERLDARVAPDNPERPASWSPQRSRPLCPFPEVARYGGGDPESARSFHCAR